MTNYDESMDEKALVQQLKSAEGKEIAFREVIKTHQKALYYHIRRMTNDHDDTDDILQNTFISVWKNVDKFREEASLKTWIYRIATNETLTFLNKKNKRAYADVSILENSVSHSESSQVPISGEEIQARLAKAITLLPEKQRLVFNMRYYDEMSFREISVILETTEGGLKANYHHAAKKIEMFLRGEQWDFA